MYSPPPRFCCKVFKILDLGSDFGLARAKDLTSDDADKRRIKADKAKARLDLCFFVLSLPPSPLLLCKVFKGLRLGSDLGFRGGEKQIPFGSDNKMLEIESPGWVAEALVLISTSIIPG